MRQRSWRVAGSHARLATIAGLTLVVLTVSSQSASAVTPSGSSSPGCPGTVTITALAIEQQLDDGRVVVDISHDGQGCPDATPARLHVHENLASSPHASSDARHQFNTDVAVGGNFGDNASFALLAAVPGECFVQFDASAGGFRRGRFFPTATCPVASHPTVAASGSVVSRGPTPASSSSTPRPPRTSHSVANFSISRTPRPPTPLAMTGANTPELISVAALLLGWGVLLCCVARPRRRH